MADLKVGIVLRAVDRATAPLKGLSRSAGGTQAALAKLGSQASRVRKLGTLRTELSALGAKLDASRKKTAELGRELKRTDDPSEKLRKAFQRSQSQTVALARAHKRQRGELRELSAGLRKAGFDTRRLGAEQERLERTSERLRRRLARLGKTGAGSRAGGGALRGHMAALGAYFGGGALLRGAGGFVGTASQLETLETTLGTIEGSSEKARASMGWINRFATTTPFQIDQVADSFVKLRAYGMDPTNGLLRTLGDTASAMGKDVMQAVEAIADAVTGENERLKEFGIKAKTKGDTITYEYTADDQTKTATANARDRAEIQRVLAGIMDSRFGGAMEDRMSTFSGMVSNLGDQWFRFERMVMESGPFEMLKGRLRGVLDRIDAMAESGELQKLAERFGISAIKGFEGFERDVLPVLRDELWPVLRDDIWPAAKSIASAVREIFWAANQVATAVGGWGNVLKAFALYKGLGLAAAAGRGLAGAGSSVLDIGGGIRDAVTSKTAKRMTGGAGKLGGRAFAAARSGIAGSGKTLGSLALRFAPLALGALKAVGAAVAGLSLPVTAAAVAIAGAAYLIWQHWEPIKGFFSRLWESVKTAFSGFWEWLSSIDWSGLGARLMGTLAKGIRSAPGLAWDALKSGLGKLADLLPSSDARAGPLSRLSSSGAAILATLGDGVRRAGSGALSRPLAGALGTAAAGLALSIPASVAAPPAVQPPTALQERLRAVTPPALQPESPAVPSSGQPAPQAARTVHHHYRITIQQLPGEDAEDLAGRVIRELERQQALSGREALGDAY